MAKSLSALNTAYIDSPYVEPRMLAEIQFSTGTIYACSCLFGTLNQLDSKIWDAVVLRWESIADGGIDPITHLQSPSGTSITVDNTVPVAGYSTFGRLLADNVAGNTTIIIYRIFGDPVDSGDMIQLFKGSIETPENMIDAEIVLSCTGFEHELISSFRHTIANETLYPSILWEDIGKMLPVPYGRPKKVPLVAVDTSNVTRLVAAVTAGASKTIEISEDIPPGLEVGDELEIDGENCEITAIVDEAWIDRTSDTYWESEGDPFWTVHLDDGDWQSYTYGDDDDDHPWAGITDITPTWAPSYWQFAFTTANSEGRLKTNGAWSSGFRPTSVKFTLSGIEGMDELIISIWAYEVDGPPGHTPNYYLTSEVVDLNFSSPRTYEYTLTTPAFDIDRIALYGSSTSGTNNLHITDLQFYGPEHNSWDGAKWVPTTTYNKCILTPKTGTTWFQTETLQEVRVTYDGADTVDLSLQAANDAYNVAVQSAYTSLDEVTYTARFADLETLLTDGNDVNTNNITKIEFLQPKIPIQVTVDVLASAHDVDAEVVLVKADHYYICEGPAKAIRNVYWNNRLVDSGSYTAYTGYNGDDATGHTGKCAIHFAATRRRQIKDSTGAVIDVTHAGRVQVDLDGICDDTSGTVTGIAGALIAEPTHIIKHILTVKCGLTTSEIDSTMAAAALATFEANNYMLSPVVMQKPDVMALLNRVAIQCASYSYWVSGQHRLRYMGGVETADHTICDYMVDAGQIWVNYTYRSEIENKMSARYAHDWSGHNSDEGVTKNIVTQTAGNSQTLYEVREKDSLSFAYITDGTQAQAALDYLQDERAHPRVVVEFAGGYWLQTVEKGDVIQFSFSSGDRLDDIFSGRILGHEKFLVIEILDRSDYAIQVKAIMLAADARAILEEDGEAMLAEDSSIIMVEA